MPFPESVKLEAKKRAHYCCTLCRTPIFLDVHHIIPESEEGPNTIENAAPLCAACHDLYGNNPDKRKQIREMRDFWWEFCEKRESNPDFIALNQKIDSIKLTQEKGFEEIKAALVTFHHTSGDSIAASTTPQELSRATGFQFPAGFSNCPHCGTPAANSQRVLPVNPGIWGHRPWRKCIKCSTEFPE